MSSSSTQWLNFTLSHVLPLLAILALALIGLYFLRVATNLLVKPAASQMRGAQAREQQTRALATGLYAAGATVICVVAVIMGLEEFGIGVLPAAALLGFLVLGVCLGARETAQDIVAGFYIILEDQYLTGDTIQTGEVIGRVEQLSLRRTLVRDARGALVTIANGEIRTVSNLSRDWSQTFVDIPITPEAPLEKSLEALETAAAGLRNDPAWSQALVDGPRVLGVHAYDQAASTLRLQVRTQPTRQDEVSRELRRRIQIEFQRQSIPLSTPPLRDRSVGSPVKGGGTDFGQPS